MVGANDKSDILLALRGFGEAASAFASGWDRSPLSAIQAYDEKLAVPAEMSAVLERLNTYQVKACHTPAEAFANADVIISLVFADRALDAAQDTAQFIRKNALYIDGNSCSPQTKQKASQIIENAGGRYVDMAVMSPVYPAKEKSPLLISGTAAEQALQLLTSMGMRGRIVGTDVGAASAIKLTRSIMIKGLEALFAECFLAAKLGGVEEEVFASLEASDPDINWRDRRDYNLDRMTVHGRRRAAEMREAANMVDELGLPSNMARSTVEWQQLLGDLPITTNNGDDVLAAFEKNLNQKS